LVSPFLVLGPTFWKYQVLYPRYFWVLSTFTPIWFYQMDGSYFFQYCKISLYLNIAALGGRCVVKFSIFVHHWRAFSLLCIAIVFVRWFTCEESSSSCRSWWRDWWFRLLFFEIGITISSFRLCEDTLVLFLRLIEAHRLWFLPRFLFSESFRPTSLKLKDAWES